jgi:hypothetical protein
MPAAPVIAVRAFKPGGSFSTNRGETTMAPQPSDRSTDLPELGFQQTVSKTLVHKHAGDNVLLTDLQKCGEGRFLCQARVPTGHSFFDEAGRLPTRDILFYTEAGRQAGIAISHAFFDIPPTHAFILSRANSCLLDTCWAADGVADSKVITIDVRIKDQEVRRGGHLAKMVADYAFSCEDHQLVQATGEWNLHPQALYARLRKMARKPRSQEINAQTEPPLEPRYLGRQRPENVVISEPKPLPDGQGLTATLWVDYGHRFFFDHPRDHIPGVMLFEAATQLATVAISRAANREPAQLIVQGCDLRFLNFAELNLPVKVDTRVTALKRDAKGLLQGTLYVHLLQGEVELAEATMRVVFPWDVYRADREPAHLPLRTPASEGHGPPFGLGLSA